MNQYTVYYCGGSGGYMFFYSLQLALKYDVESKLRKQWNVDKFENWKFSETANNQDSNHSRLNGIRLYCSPSAIDKDDISILLYTDIETQEELARLKHAYWYSDFVGQDKIGEEVLGNMHIISYNNVKDESWPNINNISEFGSLPNQIKEELINDFSFPCDITSIEAWKRYLILGSAVNFNGIQVDPHILEHNLVSADYSFTLQDVVNTKFKCVCDALDIPHNEKVEEHVNNWVALHPENIQQLLHKTI